MPSCWTAFSNVSVLCGQSDTIAQPLVNDLAVLMRLPVRPMIPVKKKQLGILTSAGPLPHQRLFGADVIRPSGSASPRHRRLSQYLSDRQARAHCASSPQLCQSRLGDEHTSLSGLAGEETACARASCADARSGHCLRSTATPSRSMHGKTQQNAYIERYNRTVRYDGLAHYLFESVDGVQEFAKKWLSTYNQERPNTGLGGITTDAEICPYSLASTFKFA